MIMYPAFIKCCQYAQNNSRLLFILVSLSKGMDFFYNCLFVKVTNKDIITTKNGKQSVYCYHNESYPSIVHYISLTFDIVIDPPYEDKVLKEYALRDYVVDSMKTSSIDTNHVNLYNYLNMCLILKLFSPKDIIFEKGRVVSILNIDSDKMSVLKTIHKKNDTRVVKHKRMDSLWLK